MARSDVRLPFVHVAKDGKSAQLFRAGDKCELLLSDFQPEGDLSKWAGQDVPVALSDGPGGALDVTFAVLTFTVPAK